MKDKEIKKACDEMKSIMDIMRRANATGDDVRIEIESGLNLLESVVSDLRSKEE
ncbi:hypothetical protein R7007_21690 [Vibrio sp. 1636]|uniref:Uncharacterized protein n=1 Tax=Vibrio alginolyticus TaxID=663 RepID=A0A7Y0R199_VIBAL|nr:MULTISPECIES: hypothetical protein [Vibrio]MDW2204285.1 hypothetical protein [Vibrio sp. 1636]NMR76221.1 hypothetical protein [Vibrio alginolyticus]